MPKIDNRETQRFDIPGVTFSPVASPSRGSSENAIWRARVSPASPGLVHHMTREEIIVATAGEGRVRIGETSHTLMPGDAFAVPAFTDFALECASAEPFEAIVVLPVGGRVVVGTDPAFPPPWSL